MRHALLIGFTIVITIFAFMVLALDDQNFEHSFMKIGNTLTAHSDNGHKNEQYKFHVFFADKHWSFPQNNYIPFSDVIKTLGGSLEIFDIAHDNQYKKIASIVIITDENSRIVGVYPQKTPRDFIDILELHPDLADFSLMQIAF